MDIVVCSIPLTQTIVSFHHLLHVPQITKKLTSVSKFSGKTNAKEEHAVEVRISRKVNAKEVHVEVRILGDYQCERVTHNTVEVRV